ncbi:MAG TPA: TIGR03435 family protein [Bryobacteraceae bacterium]|jgi:uncharacterized protein (TIGR03435 family)|nr:TIGR03435 family protein [Bryobacteraceae bacterium]
MPRLAIVLFSLPLALAAQRPRFEVASIKPFVAAPAAAGRGGGCVPFRMDAGRVDVCGTLAAVIAYAYRIPRDRIVGPDWLTTRRADQFAIAAKLPDGAAPRQVPEMLQGLLADRFHLAAHRGSREEAVTALVVAKGGLKLPEAAAGEDDEGLIENPAIGAVRTSQGPGPTYRWEAPRITFAGLALLCSTVGFVPPVVDMTRLKGRYRVDLTVSLHEAFAAADQAHDDMQYVLRDAFNTALHPLGLTLEPRKGTVETLIVDRVEKAPTAN